MGVVAGCLFALLVVWCVIDYSRPLMYRGSGLGAVSIVLALIMAAEVAALFYFPGCQGDLNVYRGWAIDLLRRGPAAFYPPGYGYAGQYAPASMYPLWLSGGVGARLHVSWQHWRLPIEIPQVVMSFVLAQTLFVYLRRAQFSPTRCWIGAMLVALNPAMIFDTVVWGQTDAFVTMLMWLMVLMTIDGGYELGAALAAAAVLTKPHALLLLPMLALWAFFYARPVRWLTAAAVFAAAVVLLTAPFALARPLDWLPRFYLESLKSAPETSLNAFNFMALVGGLWQSESGGFWDLTYFEMGMALSSCVLLLSLCLLWRRRLPATLILAAFIALFGNFVFAPRMHERYLYPALIFLVPEAMEQPWVMGIFAAVSASAFFNDDYVLHAMRTIGHLPTHDTAAMAAAVFNLALFALVAAYTLRLYHEPNQRLSLGG